MQRISIVRSLFALLLFALTFSLTIGLLTRANGMPALCCIVNDPQHQNCSGGGRPAKYVWEPKCVSLPNVSCHYNAVTQKCDATSP